ncbi:MAG: hypothetical protein PUF41_07870, partial [Prevotella copri]|nr:hypothetical protein [Segatella copri]
KGHRVNAGYGVFFFFIVLIYFPAKLTIICRYKDFHLFIFPSANIIEGACYFYGLHDLWCELLIWAFNYPIRPVVRINSEQQE